MSTGDKIRHERKKQGLSMKQLGKMIGLSEQAISQYERGVRKISFDTLMNISKALEIPISAFDSDGYHYYDNGVCACGLDGEKISFSEMINSLYDPFLGRSKEEIINMCEYASKILKASNIEVHCRKDEEIDEDFKYLIYIRDEKRDKKNTAILFPQEFFVEAEKITWFMKNEISTLMEFNNE